MSQFGSGSGWMAWLVRWLRQPLARGAHRPVSSSDQDAARSKAALKALLERKRQNDFVRQREFDALRKIRRQARAQEEAADLPASMFQSSLPSFADDRASTIRKINEIEAQMSSQWWTANASSDAPVTDSHPSGWLDGPDSGPPSSFDFFTTPATARASVLALDAQDTQPLSYLRQRRSSTVPPVWTSPPNLDASAVAALQRTLATASQPWILDWSGLATLQVKAARALLGLLSLWADQDVRLRFMGADVLRQRLADMTPAGRRDVEQLWWELRLAALRVMNLPGEFDEVARDCCTIHEIPRPLWEPPRCECLPWGLA
jgi:hypothetical protein